MTTETTDREIRQMLSRAVAECSPALSEEGFTGVIGRAARRRRRLRVAGLGAASAVAIGVTAMVLIDRTDPHQELDTVGPAPFVEVSIDDPSGTEVLPSAPLDVRGDAAVVWTGSELVVWGGHVEAGNMGLPGGDRSYDDGAAYDPTTKTWRTLSAGPLPAAGTTVGAMTRDGVLLVRGRTAAVWNPASDTWDELEAAPRPVLDLFSAGDVVISRSANARLDLDSGRWTDLPEPPARLERATSAWTGEDLVVIGGEGTPFASAVAIAYNATDDAWRTIAAPPSDLHAEALAAAWDGSRIVVVNYDMRAVAYAPATDTWRDLPPVPARFSEWQPLLEAAGGVSIATMCCAVAVLSAEDEWVPLPYGDLEIGQVVSTAPSAGANGVLFSWAVDAARNRNVLSVSDPARAAAPARVQVGLAGVPVPAGFRVTEASYSGFDAETVRVTLTGAAATCTLTSRYAAAIEPTADERPEMLPNDGIATQWFRSADDRSWRTAESTSDVLEIACDTDIARALAEGTALPLERRA